jgi:hypothetical protein
MIGCARGHCTVKNFFFKSVSRQGVWADILHHLSLFNEAGPVGDQKEKRRREKENFHRAILFHVQI